MTGAQLTESLVEMEEEQARQEERLRQAEETLRVRR